MRSRSAILASLVVIAGCGGHDEAVSSDDSGTANHDAPGPFDAPRDPDAMVVGPVTIIVLDDGVPLPGAPCAFHDAAGTLIAAMTSDDDGVCTHVIGAGHMATVGHAVGNQRWLATYVVDPGMTVRIHWFPFSGPRIGTLAFDVPGPVAGATVVAAHNGCTHFEYDFGESASLPVYGGPCVVGSDQDSLYLEALDAATREPKAWTSVSPITVDGLVTVTIPDWNTTFSTFEARVVDLPVDNTYLELSCYLRIHDHIQLAASSLEVTAPRPGQTYSDTVWFPLGITSRVDCYALWSAGSCFVGQSVPDAVLTLDGDDLPVQPTDVVVDTTVVSRPSFSWTQGASGVTPDVTRISYAASSGNITHNWWLHTPGVPGANSLMAPELPAGAPWSELVPVAANTLPATAGTYSHSEFDGYSEYVASSFYSSGSLFGPPGRFCSTYASEN